MYRNCSSNDDDNDNIDKYIIYKYNNNIHEYDISNNDGGRGGGDDDEINNDNSMQELNICKIEV